MIYALLILQQLRGFDRLHENRSRDETVVKSAERRYTRARACTSFSPFCQHKKRNERKKRHRESNRQLHKIEPIKS